MLEFCAWNILENKYIRFNLSLLIDIPWHGSYSSEFSFQQTRADI